MWLFIWSAARAISSNFSLGSPPVRAGSRPLTRDAPLMPISRGTSLSMKSSIGPTRSDRARRVSFLLTTSSATVASMGDDPARRGDGATATTRPRCRRERRFRRAARPPQT